MFTVCRDISMNKFSESKTSAAATSAAQAVKTNASGLTGIDLSTATVLRAVSFPVPSDAKKSASNDSGTSESIGLTPTANAGGSDRSGVPSADAVSTVMCLVSWITPLQTATASGGFGAAPIPVTRGGKRIQLWMAESDVRKLAVPYPNLQSSLQTAVAAAAKPARTNPMLIAGSGSDNPMLMRSGSDGSNPVVLATPESAMVKSILKMIIETPIDIAVQTSVESEFNSGTVNAITPLLTALSTFIPSRTSNTPPPANAASVIAAVREVPGALNWLLTFMLEAKSGSADQNKLIDIVFNVASQDRASAAHVFLKLSANLSDGIEQISADAAAIAAVAAASAASADEKLARNDSKDSKDLKDGKKDGSKSVSMFSGDSEMSSDPTSAAEDKKSFAAASASATASTTAISTSTKDGAGAGTGTAADEAEDDSVEFGASAVPPLEPEVTQRVSESLIALQNLMSHLRSNSTAPETASVAVLPWTALDSSAAKEWEKEKSKNSTNTKQSASQPQPATKSFGFGSTAPAGATGPTLTGPTFGFGASGNQLRPGQPTQQSSASFGGGSAPASVSVTGESTQSSCESVPDFTDGALEGAWYLLLGHHIDTITPDQRRRRPNHSAYRQIAMQLTRLQSLIDAWVSVERAAGNTRDSIDFVMKREHFIRSVLLMCAPKKRVVTIPRKVTRSASSTPAASASAAAASATDKKQSPNEEARDSVPALIKTASKDKAKSKSSDGGFSFGSSSATGGGGSGFSFGTGGIASASGGAQHWSSAHPHALFLNSADRWVCARCQRLSPANAEAGYTCLAGCSYCMY